MSFSRLKEVLGRAVKTRLFYFCILLGILNLFTTWQAMFSRGFGGFWAVALAEVVLECGVITTLVFMRKKGVSIENQFLLIAIVLGLFFIAVLPPGQSPDEGGHFMRAYGIADGHFVADEIGGGGVGSSIPVEADFLLQQAGWRKGEGGTYGRVFSELSKNVSGEEKIQSYNTLAVYNFVCYFPQATAIFVGKTLGLSVLAMAYLAEIFNFAIWVLLVYFAIKVMPRFKMMLLFIALLPITIQEATSLAPDALTIGLGIFMISYVMHIVYGGKTLLKNGEKVILALTAVVMSLCKIVYLPMIFLYLILPARKFGSKKKKWIFVVGVITLAIILNLAWLTVSFNYILETNPGVDAKGQVMGILGNPLYYTGVLVHTFGEYFSRWMNEFFGMSLGAMDFRLPSLYFVMSFVVLVMILSQRNETLKMSISERCVIIGVFVAVCLLICTSLYVQWTTCGNEIIEGIQGRYFLPIALLVPLMICRRKEDKKYSALITERTVLCYGFFVGVMACVIIGIQNI